MNRASKHSISPQHCRLGYPIRDVLAGVDNYQVERHDVETRSFRRCSPALFPRTNTELIVYNSQTSHRAGTQKQRYVATATSDMLERHWNIRHRELVVSKDRYLGHALENEVAHLTAGRFTLLYS